MARPPTRADRAERDRDARQLRDEAPARHEAGHHAPARAGVPVRARRRDGALLVPTYHPAAVLRGGGQALAEIRADFVKIKRVLTGTGVIVRTTSATRDARRRRSDRVVPRGRATSSCSPAISARARRRSRRASRPASVSIEPVVSPTFAIVREYEGRVPVAHVDVYRLEHVQELHDLGFEEIVDGDRVVLVEWGDLVAPVLPGERLVVELRRVDDDADDEREIVVHAEGSARSPATTARLRRCARGVRSRLHRIRRAAADVLLLAIDTSTRRVGVAFGVPIGVLAALELGGAGERRTASPRRAARPRDRVPRSRRARLARATLSADRRRVGPGHVHRAARRRHDREGDGAGAPRPGHPDPEPRSRRVPVASRDGRVRGARRSTPAATSSTTRAYRPVPGGIQRESEYELATPRDLARRDRGARASRSWWPATVRCGSGSSSRRTSCASSPARASRRPSLAALVELASGRFEREEFASAADVVPMYLRRSDAEIADDRRPA